MKKITSDMLKGVGIDTVDFDKEFPDGMEINVFNVDRIKKSFDFDINDIIDKLLPIDISVEYNKRLDDLNSEYHERFSECHNKYNSGEKSDSNIEYAREIKESLKRERFLRRRYNSVMRQSREEYEIEWSAIENELVDREVDITLDTLKKCDKIRCIGKTM
jgi:hypothetical protein